MKIRGAYDNNLHPARFGGPERIYRLYRSLARGAEVTVLSLLKSREPGLRSETVEGIRIERRWPLYPTLVHYGERARLWPMHAVFRLHRALGARYAFHFEEPNAVYQFDSFLLTAWYHRVPAGALKVYHAVNVESDWHAPMLRRLLDPEAARRSLAEIERHAVQGADLVVCVSREDAARLEREFGAAPERLLHVPNGFEPTRFEAPAPAAREALREELGIRPGQRVAAFTGSRMQHNLDAARCIARELAPRALKTQPELRFLLIGDLPIGPLPPNVRATGPVEDVPRVLTACDLAVNPVTSGSGSSLKLPEFLAARLPVASTPFGMRGFEELLDLVTLAEPADMLAALARPKALPADVARRLAPFAWDRQADKLRAAYAAWLEDPEEAPRRWASIG